MTNLTLFMTYGSSLVSWRDAGILDREMALYDAHDRAGYDVSIVTYGGAEDLELAAAFPFATVLCNRHGLHLRLYAWLVPALHARALGASDVFKTNQLYGAHVASRSARVHRKPLLVRQGYGHYEHRVEEHGASSRFARDAWRYEHRYLRRADAVAFTTPDIASRAIQRHGLDPSRVNVVANYVVPADWTPPYQAPPPSNRTRVCCVGRLSDQKNLAYLIRAMEGLEATLDLVGDGPLRDDLEALARDRGVTATFHGRLDQHALREVMRACDLFIIPSLYEGHPKALLEAMAFGMPVLAADSPGIREQVVDGRNAVLATADQTGLRSAIQRLMGEAAAGLRERLGGEARREVLSRYGVEAVAELERTVLERVLER